MSTDQFEDQARFAVDQSLNFPLAIDPNKKLVDAVGCGRGAYAARITLVIDKKGIIRKVYKKVSVRNHAEEVLDFVRKKLASAAS